MRGPSTRPVARGLPPARHWCLPMPPQVKCMTTIFVSVISSMA